MALVYRATCRTNGKHYVGMTTRTLARRVRQHVWEAESQKTECRAFHAALRKYGEDGFVWEVLADGLTRDEAWAAEVRWIEEMCSMVPSGYNLLTGGKTGRPTREVALRRMVSRKGHVVSEETRERIAARLRGTRRPASVVAKMSAARTGSTWSDQMRASFTKTIRGKLLLSDAQATNARILRGLGASSRRIGEWMGVSHVTVQAAIKRPSTPANED